MWTDTTRAQHARDAICLPSCLSDAEWAVLEPSIPRRKFLGRPAKWPLRQIVDAILYVLRGRVAWRMLPRGEFPPMTTLQHYFYRWRDSGLWQSVNYSLLMDVRVALGREASPSAGVIDSQSVNTTESGGMSGFDAGKKIKGRKHHIITETNGFLVRAVVHSAGVQDRDGAPLVFKAIRQAFPWLRHVFADGGYAGKKLRGALKGKGDWKLKIVKRSDTAKGFEVIPRR